MAGLMHVHIHIKRVIKKSRVSSHYVVKDNGNLLIRRLPERKFLNYLLLIKMKVNRSNSEASLCDCVFLNIVWESENQEAISCSSLTFVCVSDSLQ